MYHPSHNSPKLAEIVSGSARIKLDELLKQIDITKKPAPHELEIYKQIIVCCHNGFNDAKPDVDLSNAEILYAALINYYKDQAETIMHLDYVYFMSYLHKATLQLIKAKHYETIFELIKAKCDYLLMLIMGYMEKIVDVDNGQLKISLSDECMEFQALQAFALFMSRQSSKACKLFIDVANSEKSKAAEALSKMFLLMALSRGSEAEIPYDFENENAISVEISRHNDTQQILTLCKTADATNLAIKFYEDLKQLSREGVLLATYALVKFTEMGLVIDQTEIVKEDKNALVTLLKLMSLQGGLFIENTGLHQLYRIISLQITNSELYVHTEIDNSEYNHLPLELYERLESIQHSLGQSKWQEKVIADNLELLAMRNINPAIITSAYEQRSLFNEDSDSDEEASNENPSTSP